jgi:hypothetical protein
VLANGEQKDFGPRDEVWRKISKRAVPPTAAPAAANLKLVSATTGGGRT